MKTMVHIFPNLEIPDEELSFATSRSSGPGGQNVNKLSTRVTVLFNVDRSSVLTSEQRELLHRRLGRRVSQEGVVRVSSQRHRTQLANRDAAVARLVQLLRDALLERPERIPVAVPKQAKERRLEEKRRRGGLKRERSRGVSLEE